MILFMRIFLAAVISCLVGFYFYRAYGLEHGNDFSARDRLFGLDKKDKTIYLGFLPLILPCGLAVVFAALVVKLGWQEALFFFFRLSANLLLTMSLYYVALLLLMPLLRRHVSARVCATAWLLPTLLYYVGYSFDAIIPRFVLYIPRRLQDVLIPVWAVGFAIFFSAAVLSHLCFRRRILRDAREECDETVLAVFREEAEQLGFKNPIRLVRTARAKTPFSMGNTKRTRVTVLPETDYTEQELRFIFRHELHHIQRGDMDSKLFFAFVCALFWFHPLVWIALREAGRDMELSCDEIVLENEGEAERKCYADLLLATAGERRGFTTCMSADASALRYRLRSIMKARTRKSGTLVLMALLFTCLMCHGVFAVSEERIALSEAFTANGADYFLYETDEGICRTYADLTADGKKELLAYLETLTVERLSGARYAAAPEKSPRLYVSNSAAECAVWIGDHSVVIYDLANIDYEHSLICYTRADIDWEKIEACFGEVQIGAHP